MENNLIGRHVEFTNTLLVKADVGNCRIPVLFTGKICGLTIGGKKDDFGPIIILEECVKIQSSRLSNIDDEQKVLMTAWISEIKKFII
jgi:hypothetical protein